jgi:hypothetical protein
MQRTTLLFDVGRELLANKKPCSLLLSSEDLWLSFGEERSKMCRWMRASGQHLSIVEPSAGSRSQAELQWIPPPAYARSYWNAWNPQAAKPSRQIFAKSRMSMRQGSPSWLKFLELPGSRGRLSA